MSKAFIAEVIQSSAEITGVAANRVAADVIEAIVMTMKNEGKFTLPSFGTFTVKKTKARKSWQDSALQGIADTEDDGLISRRG
jgi:DNA-binding protein HU-beta